MARSISSANQAALEERALVARDFLWVVARKRSDNSSQTFGFWSDIGTTEADVVNPDTGDTNTRSFVGAGALIAIDDIPLVSNLTVQTVAIHVSQIDDTVNSAFRNYDLRQARVEIYRGLYDPDTRSMVDAAECRFVGFVDNIEVKTPTENEAGYVGLTCASHTREMTRSNPDTRSHESQKLRSATDDFYKDTSTVGEWEHFWGTNKGKIDSDKAGKGGGGSGSNAAPPDLSGQQWTVHQ